MDEIIELYKKALRAANGDSNDDEIDAWQNVALEAMSKLGIDMGAIEREIGREVEREIEREIEQEQTA